MPFLIAFLAASLVAAQDPRAILSLALERDERNLELLNTYIYERKTVQRTYGKNGGLQQTSEKLHEVFHVDGSEIERLIAKDGKPLSEKEQREEQRRVDKLIEKFNKQSPQDRARRRRESEKDRREEIEARREVLDAFDFTLTGVESIRGRSCWGIRGEPRPGFTGKGRRADQMRKVRGTVWIDQQTHEFTRMDLDTHGTISFGWFLFRLQPGARIRLEQTLVNNEVWLPVEVGIRADARLLGKMLRIGLDIEHGKFRKFSSESKLVVAQP
ncbi:MAG: hypothetical protein K7J46_11610 [Bryobacter sp.]|jgi:hypothetical protein|nr:hypothetical protein [Bryobacter sp. CoA8 C33]